MGIPLNITSNATTNAIAYNVSHGVPLWNKGNYSYRLDYSLLNSTWLTINLTLTSFNTTAWVPGVSGLWLGLSYGAYSNSSNTDFTLCVYSYNNLTADQFQCTDMYFDANAVPQSNEYQDLYSVATLIEDTVRGNFKVSYQRPLSPTDVPSGEDFNLSLTQNNDFQWSFGSLAANGSPAFNDSTQQMGSFALNLASGAVSTYIPSFAREFLSGSLAIALLVSSLI